MRFIKAVLANIELDITFMITKRFSEKSHPEKSNVTFFLGKKSSGKKVTRKKSPGKKSCYFFPRKKRHPEKKSHGKKSPGKKSLGKKVTCLFFLGKKVTRKKVTWKGGHPEGRSRAFFS